MNTISRPPEQERTVFGLTPEIQSQFSISVNRSLVEELGGVPYVNEQLVVLFTHETHNSTNIHSGLPLTEYGRYTSTEYLDETDTTKQFTEILVRILPIVELGKAHLRLHDMSFEPSSQVDVNASGVLLHELLHRRFKSIAAQPLSRRARIMRAFEPKAAQYRELKARLRESEEEDWVCAETTRRMLARPALSRLVRVKELN